MGGSLNPFDGGSSGSTVNTVTETVSQTVLENETNISSEVIFDFEAMAEVYRERLNWDIEQSLLENDGEFTEEQQIKIREIVVQEEALKLQQKANEEQTQNNRYILYLTILGLFLGYKQFTKKGR